MSRGKPCPEQLDLSADMMKLENYIGENGVDTRNYGYLEGIPEARRFFADVMRVPSPEQVLVCGNSALSTMYYLIDLGWRAGFVDSIRPWRFCTNIKFLCPTPGYDRHFKVTEYFGFQLIPVPMLETGPDMDVVERLVKDDDSVKGIWCVPVYSNPDGYSYSDDTVRRLAAMETAAPDFKIFWDDAYCVHTLTDEVYEVLPILDECAKAVIRPGDDVLLHQQDDLPRRGRCAVATSRRSVEHILNNMSSMIISYDKMNQLRHVRFLKDRKGVLEHMAKHRAIIAPKFELVREIFARDLGSCPASPTGPTQGRLLPEPLRDGRLRQAHGGAVQAGGRRADPRGRCLPLRHRPPRPSPAHRTHLSSLAELEQAATLLCICVRIATLEKLLTK